ncbi:MAG: bifunctional adenosylcobinamide kinase/adenosylcobinamide-phosphate guanylyltransferase [Magnetococcales bacterium]|nr:bifunctional adenosylcobinamide kinase/adenosylcobinamide-phosphate guanylyltransferase [Magnetococcales bacterium]
MSDGTDAVIQGSELVLGGVRSGKSGYAQLQAERSGGRVHYIATARNSRQDSSMQERIARHRRLRPDHWTVIEEPLYLADTLVRHASEENCLLVECLTLWLTNISYDTDDQERFIREREHLLEAIATLPGRIILVANEVGLGVMPMAPEVRGFLDQAGMLNQEVARRVDAVTLVAAGLPLPLKSPPVAPTDSEIPIQP